MDSNPRAKPFKKPYRVETWSERGEFTIDVYDADDRLIASWDTEGVNEMIESGYFDTSGFIMGREVRPGKLENSVLAYVSEVGMDHPRKNPAYHKNFPQEMSWWAKWKALTTGKHDEENPPDVFAKHQIRIARSTLKMSDVWARIMGGMTKEEAREVLARHGIKRPPEDFEDEENPPDHPIRLTRKDVESARSLDHAAAMRREAAKWQDIARQAGATEKQVKDPKFMSRFWSEHSIPRSRHHHMKNPPLPASALMDITTARTIINETERGERQLSALREASALLHTAMMKLRTTHNQKVDFSNPPMTEIYRDVVDIRAVKPNGERFVHKFEKGSNIFGLANGDILIRSRKGKRLWKNFK